MIAVRSVSPPALPACLPLLTVLGCGPCVIRVVPSVGTFRCYTFVLFPSYSAWTGERCFSLFWLRIKSLQPHCP